MSREKYLGYQKADFELPYAKFFDKTVLPMPSEVAAQQQRLSSGSIPALSEIAHFLMQDGYAPTEIGYTLEKTGEQRIAVLTKMPNVTPPMWDWWFGWHGCSDSRYKLWHPKAHVSAAWQDGKNDLAYVGRTSQIQEYIGKKLEKANIQFLDPQVLGFSKTYLDRSDDAVVIVARLGLTAFPLNFGYLIHQIRKTADGAEMRSRFFVGGAHIALRAENFIAKKLWSVVAKIYRLPEQQAVDLLSHCSEEMNHIAKFLPQLYQENQ